MYGLQEAWRNPGVDHTELWTEASIGEGQDASTDFQAVLTVLGSHAKLEAQECDPGIRDFGTVPCAIT